MIPDLNRGRWAPKTRQSYEISWRDFSRWCAKREHESLPADPQDIADFLTERAETLATSTLSGRLAAIVAVHSLYGHELPVKGSVIRDAWAEIRRRKGTAGTPKAALTADDIKRIVRGIPADRQQDRAIVLCAFASLMRRSELAALDIEDVEFSDTAMSILIRHSKTDKAGKGERIAIPRTETEFCPVTAVVAWRDAAGISHGPLFRMRTGSRLNPRKVADIAKRWGKEAGFDPRVIGAHSFRRGGITTMFRNGAKIEDIMRHSRHRTVSIALGYVEAQRAELNPAIAALGL